MLLIPSAVAAQGTLEASLKKHLDWSVKKAGPRARIVLSVVDVANGEVIFEHQAAEPLAPASLLKIITSFAALRLLGAEYRFPTEVFSDRAPRPEDGSVGNIYIRGYGDPTLVEERIWAIGQSLRSAGVDSVNDLVIDDSLFIDPPKRSGASPYQAGIGAAAANYNCYSIDIAPGALGRPARVSVPYGISVAVKNEVITTEKGGKLIVRESALPATKEPPAPEGKFQELTGADVLLNISGSISPKAGLIREYHTASDPTRLYAELFRHFLVQAGIRVDGKLLRGRTPAGADRLHVYKSKELGEILVDLNHYSNNVVAGQLLFAMGQDSVGFFRLDAAVDRVRNVLVEAGISPKGLLMYDGSGLDKRNRTTARQIVQVLTSAYRDFSIAPVFIASLSRFGHSGTLKKRPLVKAEKSDSLAQRASAVWGKTGTLDDVSALAGYAESESGRRLAYAIMINGPVTKAVCKSIENKLVQILVGLPTKLEAES